MHQESLHGLRGIPRGIWALGFVSMFMDVFSEMIHSLLPVFLVSVLGASATAVGLLEGLAEGTVNVVKWEAHFPVNLVDKYRDSLLKLRGIWLDYGTRDEFPHIPIATSELSNKLAKAGIPHRFEVFDGTHDSKAPERVGTRMLPYFSQVLQGESSTSNANK